MLFDEPKRGGPRIVAICETFRHSTIVSCRNDPQTQDFRHFSPGPEKRVPVNVYEIWPEGKRTEMINFVPRVQDADSVSPSTQFGC
jgi:hypothetical protein